MSFRHLNCAGWARVRALFAVLLICTSPLPWSQESKTPEEVQEEVPEDAPEDGQDIQGEAQELDVEDSLRTPEESLPVVPSGDQAEGALDAVVVPPPQAMSWLERMILSSSGRARLEERGRDEAGRPLHLMTLAPWGSPSVNGTLPGAADSPGLLLFGDGPEQRLFMEAFASPKLEATRALCSRVVIYYLPEVGSPMPGRGELDFTADFPIGWLPASMRPGAGLVPLARADSQVLRAVLLEHRNIVSILIPAAAPAPAANPFDDPAWSGPEGKENTYGLPSGSLEQYAWRVFGIPTFELEGEGELPYFRHAQAVPHLTGSVAKAASMGEGQWQVDLELQNRGRLPTSFAPSDHLQDALGLGLEIEGARVLASAIGSSREGLVVTYGRKRDGQWRLGMSPLAGGAVRTVRLILEAPEGAEVLVRVDGAWTEEIRLSVPLLP